MEDLCGRMIIPPRPKTLSTAALDAGTLSALSAGRYSLPRLLLYWCQNGKHSSLCGSSMSRYFLICCIRLLVVWEGRLVYLVKSFGHFGEGEPSSCCCLCLYLKCKSTGRWSIFNIVSKTCCVQHYVQTKKIFAVDKYSSLKYKYKYLDLIHEYNSSTSTSTKY